MREEILKRLVQAGISSAWMRGAWAFRCRIWDELRLAVRIRVNLLYLCRVRLVIEDDRDTPPKVLRKPI